MRELDPVVQHVSEVDAKVEHHSSYIWGMLGTLAITTIIIIAIIMVIYKRSQKFFGKVRYIRQKFDDISNQIGRLNNLRHRVTDGIHRPHLSQLRHTLVHPATSIKNRLGWHTQAPEHNDDASIYVSMHNIPQSMEKPTNLSNNPILSSLKEKNQNKDVHKVPYPDLSASRMDEEMSLLEEENKQVEELCKKYRRDQPEN